MGWVIIAAVPLQIEMRSPARGAYSRIAGSIIGITINNENIARAIGIEPINRDSHRIDGRHRPISTPRADIIARSELAQI